MSVSRRIRNLDRLRTIGEVAIKHGFGYFLERYELMDLVPWHQKLFGPDVAEGSRGRRLRLMLEELGPTFVKFGQLLSTRPDLVPPDIALELRELQDAVAPFPYEEVDATLRRELGLGVDQLFTEFAREPIASASIGQVHRATLPNGDEVAVKVQRPEAATKIAADVDVLLQLAHLAADHAGNRLPMDPVAVVEEFARTTRAELDYRIEGRHADELSRVFEGDRRVVIPRVYWSYTRTRVLTATYIRGTEVADLDLDGMEMPARRELVDHLATLWLEMIFEHGLFHADPHPANVILMADGRLGLVDFGMVGRIGRQDLAAVTSLFVSAIAQDIDVLPRRLRDIGVHYSLQDEERLQTKLSELFAKYYGARLADVDPLEVIQDLFQTIYQLHLRLPSRFVLLDKTIVTLAGVGVAIYPQFNFFEMATPYARRLVAEQMTPKALAERGRTRVARGLTLLGVLPEQIHDVLERLRRGEAEIKFRHVGLEVAVKRMGIIVNRLVLAVLIAALVVGASLVAVFASGGPRLFGMHAFGVMGLAVAACFGVWVIAAILRSGRL